MYLRSKVVSGLIWATVEQIVTIVATLATFIILARLLTPSAFGIVALASLVVALTANLADFGLSDAIIQHQDLADEHKSTAFWFQLILAIASAGILWLGAKPIAELLREDALAPMIKVLSSALPLSALAAVPVALLRRQLKIKLLAIRSIIALVCGGIIGVALALNGAGAWSLVCQQLTQVLVGLFVIWTGTAWRPQLQFSLARLRKLACFGVGVFATRFVETASRRADEALIGSTLGTALLGVYAGAARLVGAPIQIFSALMQQVAMPTLSQVQDDRLRFVRAYLEAIELAALLSLPAFVALLALAREVVLTLLGSQWVDSVAILRILVLLGLAQVMMQVTATAIIAQGKPAWNLRISVLTGFLRFVGCLMAFPFGLQAVAVAFIVGTLIVVPIQLQMLRHLVHFEIRQFFALFAVPILGSLCMGTLICGGQTWLDESLPVALRLAVLLLISGVGYVAVVGVLKRELFKRIINHIRLARFSSARAIF